MRYDAHFLINPNYHESLNVLPRDSEKSSLLRKIYNSSYVDDREMTGDFDKGFFPAGG